MTAIQGVGAGLRNQHFEVFLSEHPPTLPWIEILADNYLGVSGISWEKVVLIAKRYPVTLHCLNCGIGNTDPINWDYCKQIKAMIEALNPVWVSDHLCWTSIDNYYAHTLLPLPFHADIIDPIVEKILQLQAFFERPFLIENISAYIRSEQDELSEASFINQITDKADCGILLDINNLFVNAHNHAESAENFLMQLNKDRVIQYHLGGHHAQDEWLIDTHNNTISESVLSLYQKALTIIGKKPTCVEWDADVPTWSVLENEVKRVNQAMNQ